MATGYEIVQTLNKKRLPNKFENLGYNRTFLNGKLTLSLHLILLWLRSYGLVGDENIAMLDNSVCMYEYVTNTVCLCKLLFVKSVYVNASNGNAIMPATRATAKQIHPSLQCSVRIQFFNNSTRWLAG